MQSYTLNRPDGALLCRVLEQHTNDAAGAILRLAWMAGLMRDEIQHLTWAQVDLLFFFPIMSPKIFSKSDIHFSFSKCF